MRKHLSQEKELAQQSAEIDDKVVLLRQRRKHKTSPLSFFGDVMAQDGVVSAFRDVAASATVERTAAQKGSASVSRVAPGLPPAAEREEKSEDVALLLRFFYFNLN